MPGERPALTRLFGPQLERVESAWGQSALLAPRAERGADDAFADLFSTAAVDELIADRGLRAPFLRLAKDGSALPEASFTSGGGVGAAVADQVNDDRVRREFADGATIVLQGLHRTWTPIKAFAQQLAAELGHPVQVNAYVTPAQNQGFSAHYDVHDVFVVQIHGEKRWTLHDPVFPHPLRSQPWEQRSDQVAEAASGRPTLESDLAPGDVLYLPRGQIHSARALGGLTIHLTIGVHTWTRTHVAEALLDAARDALAADPALRASLPLGADVAVPDAAGLDEIRSALIDALARVDAATVAAAMRARHRSGQRPESLGPIAQLAAADGLTPASVLTLRAHLLATLEGADEGLVVVRSRAGRFSLPADLEPALRRLLGGEPVAARVFGDHARTLLVEGIAVAHD